jgi:hypothetical protein
MKEGIDKESLREAQVLSIELGDLLIEKQVPLHTKINTTAMLHASMCYCNGLDLHTAVESVMFVYKQIEKEMGKL